MNKEEYIERYGQVAFEKMRQQGRDWNEDNPEKIKEAQHETNRKGGRYYEHRLKYEAEGLPYEKKLIRLKHRSHYHQYKKIIAPESQIHHEWLPGTAEYTGVALVEAKPHQYGYIDVIQILEGEITLLTEEAIRNGGMVI